MLDELLLQYHRPAMPLCHGFAASWTSQRPGAAPHPQWSLTRYVSFILKK